jgi:hypothetical protein
MTCEQKK